MTHATRQAASRAVRVVLRPDVKPVSLGTRESALRAEACPPDLMAEVESLQHELAAKVWSAPPDAYYRIEPVSFPYDPGKLRGDVGKRDCPPARSPG